MIYMIYVTIACTIDIFSETFLEKKKKKKKNRAKNIHEKPFTSTRD